MKLHKTGNCYASNALVKGNIPHIS